MYHTFCCDSADVEEDARLVPYFGFGAALKAATRTIDLEAPLRRDILNLPSLVCFPEC